MRNTIEDYEKLKAEELQIRFEIEQLEKQLHSKKEELRIVQGKLEKCKQELGI